MMVPKTWVTKLILVKLLSLCLSLANELRLVKNADFSKEEEVKDEQEKQVTYEENLERIIQEEKTI